MSFDGGSLSVGSPRLLFSGVRYGGSFPTGSRSVGPNGRFLLLRLPDDEALRQTPPNCIRRRSRSFRDGSRSSKKKLRARERPERRSTHNLRPESDASTLSPLARSTNLADFPRNSRDAGSVKDRHYLDELSAHAIHDAFS